MKAFNPWDFQQGFLDKRVEEFQLFKAHSDNYICSLIPGTSRFQAQYTPGKQFSPPILCSCQLYGGTEINIYALCRGPSLQSK